MSMHEVVLSKRGARLMLNNEYCRVIIEKYHPQEVLISIPPILENDMIRIQEHNMIVPLTDITKIEVGNRFNPNIKSMMTVDWED